MGEYSGLSQMLRPAAYALCDACAVSAGQEVLDVAAGDGNFAVACAEEGASVVASDLAPGMVEQGRARTEAEGCDIEWVEADVEDLPFEDARFDCVGSVFGAMIAPRPRVVAEEMFRVVRPGNTVGMTVWMPEGPTYEMFQVTRSYSDDAAATCRGSRSGRARRWCASASTGSPTRSRWSGARCPWPADSPEAFVADMERHAPMQAAAKANMPADDYARLREELVELAQAAGRAGTGRSTFDAPYILIVARKRG